MSHNTSVRRLFPRSIFDSLILVYYTSAGVVQKGRTSHKKAIFTTIEMYVDEIFVLAWTCRYAASRYMLPIRMHYEGHFMRMAEIMWSILRRHKPQKHGCSVSLVGI